MFWKQGQKEDKEGRELITIYNFEKQINKEEKMPKFRDFHGWEM